MSITENVKKFLVTELVRWVHNSERTQKDAAAILGMTQPRLSNLMNGHLDKFSTDSLLEYLSHAGYQVSMGVEKEQLTITVG